MFTGFDDQWRQGSISRPDTPYPTRATSPVATTETLPERNTPRRRNTVGGCTSITLPDQVLLLRPRNDKESIRLPRLERSGGVDSVGPWPLRRNGSSSTTSVIKDVRCGTPDTYSDLEQTESEFSQLMRDIDRQYDEIRKLVRGRTLSMTESPDLPNPFVPFNVPRVMVEEQVRRNMDSHRFSEDGITIVDGHQEANMAEVSIGTDGNPIRLCTCCHRCAGRVKASARYATAGLVVLGLCFIIALSMIFVMLKVFSPQGKVVLDDHRGGIKQAKSLFLGLLMLCVLTTGAPFAIALTLLLELRRTKKGWLRSRRVLALRAGSVLVWYAVMVFCWMIAFMSFSIMDVPYPDTGDAM